MAKIKNPGFSPEFQALAAQSRDNADCAVKAVALAAKRPYEEVRALMASLGRKAGHGTVWIITERALAVYGLQAKQILRAKFIERYPGAHKTLRSITTHHPARFPGVWADGKTYLFRTAKHVLAVINGVNHDWTRGKALRVRVLYEVCPLNTFKIPAATPVQADIAQAFPS